MNDTTDKTIAYLTSAYARVGDTFIRREVECLRKLGYCVHTFSIRKTYGEDASDDIRREQETTDFILEHGPFALLWATLLEKMTHPVTYLTATWLAFCTRDRGLRGLMLQVVYLMEASYLARKMRALGVRHLHNHIPANSANVAMLASCMTGIPYSMTVHGPTVFTKPEAWALPTKIERSAFTVCISSYTRSQCMLWTAPAHWEKLKIVRCGVDELFLEAELAPITQSPRFVFVGRLCADKGALVLIDALKQLRALGLAFELDMVGDGPARREIETALQAEGLADVVTLHGWCSSERVHELLGTCRALVLPSFAEGLPVVMMESLALGRPVVGTYISGIPELIEPGVNGWLVPAGSSEALAKALGEVVKATSAELEAMGRAGALAIADMHDVRKETQCLAGYIEASIQGGF